DHIERKRDKGFLSTFDRWWGQAMFPAPVTMEIGSVPLFTGGWFLYLGYELAREIEPTLDFPAAPGDFPIAFAIRFPAAVIRDHDSGEVTLVAETGHGDLLNQMEADLATLAQSPPQASVEKACLEGDLAEDPPGQHLENMRRCIDYIYAGDVFQVNLSRAWRGRLSSGLSHADLYDRLRTSNPSPFAGLVTRGGDAIISSSPERLVEVRGRIIQTRPIAGTRPRGSSGITDVALSEELLAHPKERAEHIMLVDLERNDISRVCKPGSVRVDEMMVVESYAHVHHIVSNVRGELARAVAPGEVVRAVFPGGTITGCPKVRCMEILAELEDVGRGPYTGSMGYVNRDGSLDLNILIRTMLREGDAVCLRAGGGIVADSDPDKELEETRDKAEGVVRALTAGT
ncbi:MAG TPA: aminodeoxychorismate synthase component I, partial [Chloroflexota bacterium]|nr:aminodeoxychorismate synthase component I [Chloroflexota bacterium]